MSDWVPIEKDAKHIARERAKARTLRKSQWWLDKLNAGICDYCGKKFPPDELTMDHIVPLARGGKSTKGNIAACCKQCNNAKKHLTPAEMLLWKFHLHRKDQKNKISTDQ
jgi:5-methylcytosine-specific restriction endonuclease McrA